MALADRAILNVAVVELQYRRGVVFLDRCGSVMLRLEEVLGTPFEGAVPLMTHGELVNSTERITVRYSPKAFTVFQNWVASPVRIEQIAPPSWEAVADTLGVGREVTRCAVRFVQMWKVDDVAEAERRIAGAGLFSENESWTVALGKPKTREFTTTSESKDGILRAALHGGQTEIKGPITTELKDVVPQYSIVLDLDYALPGDVPFSVGKGQMKDFIRSSWQRAKAASSSIHSLLAAASR